MSDQKTQPKVKSVYDDATELDPVIYADEDTATYLAFRRRIWEVLDPADEVEAMLVVSVVNDQWEAARYRRMLPKFVASCEQDGLRALLADLRVPPDRADRLVNAFYLGDGGADVGQVLTSAGHDMETVRAKAMAIHIDTVGRLEHLLTAKEKRRDRCLRALMKRQSARREAADAPHPAK